jgi:hypothetical protein
MLMIENVEAAGALCLHNGTRAMSEATMGKDSYWATLCIYITCALDCFCISPALLVSRSVSSRTSSLAPGAADSCALYKQ